MGPLAMNKFVKAVILVMIGLTLYLSEPRTLEIIDEKEDLIQDAKEGEFQTNEEDDLILDQKTVANIEREILSDLRQSHFGSHKESELQNNDEQGFPREEKNPEKHDNEFLENMKDTLVGKAIDKRSRKEIGCNANLTGEKGQFSSPGYPKNYPINTECTIVIKVAAGKRIHVNIGHMDLEDERTCAWDYLQFNDGEQETDPVLGKFCGKKNNVQVESSGNSLRVYFFSDTTATFKGYKITWKTVKAEGVTKTYLNRQLEKLVKNLRGEMEKQAKQLTNLKETTIKIGSDHKIKQSYLPGGYSDYSAYDLQWQSLHMAVAAACRGITEKHNKYNSPVRKIVLSRVKGRSCITICRSTRFKICDGEVSLHGYMRKATKSTDELGMFFNYGCDSTHDYMNYESAMNYKDIVKRVVYNSYCCCRSPW